MSRFLEMAKRDARRYVNNGGFNQELTITPTGENAVSIQGLATRHSQEFDGQGLPIIGDNAHCSFSELDLNDLGVTTRNAIGDLIIKGWQVTWVDALGTVTYEIGEQEPDNTLGIIRTKLVDRG